MGFAEIRSAAEQGDADAQYKLGFCYLNGDGVPSDPAEGMRWWRKAAAQGHADAQVAVASFRIPEEEAQRTKGSSFEIDLKQEEEYCDIEFPERERYVAKLSETTGVPPGHLGAVLHSLKKSAVGDRDLKATRLLLSLLASPNAVMRQSAAAEFKQLCQFAAKCGGFLAEQIKASGKKIVTALELDGLDLDSYTGTYIGEGLNCFPFLDSSVLNRVREIMRRLAGDLFHPKNLDSTLWGSYLARFGTKEDAALIQAVIARRPRREVAVDLHNALYSLQTRLGCLPPFDQAAAIQALSDSEEWVRWNAASQLGLRASREAIPGLREALQRETSCEVKNELVWALGMQGFHAKNAVPDILQAFSEKTRCRVGEALYRIGVDATPTVLDFAKGTTEKVRRNLRYSYFDRTAEELLAPLQNRVEDPDAVYSNWVKEILAFAQRRCVWKTTRQ